jgi:hypothetical protein
LAAHLFLKVIGFHNVSVQELRTAFHEAVDDYLATCEKIGRPPQKPYSGKLMLRIPPGSACPRRHDGEGPWHESQPVGCRGAVKIILKLSAWDALL